MNHIPVNCAWRNALAAWNDTAYSAERKQKGTWKPHAAQREVNKMTPPVKVSRGHAAGAASPILVGISKYRAEAGLSADSRETLTINRVHASHSGTNLLQFRDLVRVARRESPKSPVEKS